MVSLAKPLACPVLRVVLSITSMSRFRSASSEYWESGLDPYKFPPKQNPNLSSPRWEASMQSSVSRPGLVGNLTPK